MTVQCAHCGEALLGSVNRCWRCGQELVAHAGPAELPPVRRAPIEGPLDGSLTAILMDEPPAEAPAPIRKGSPFAGKTPAEVKLQQKRYQFIEPIKTPRRQLTAYSLASQVSILMGLVALTVAYPFSPGAFAIAVAGIGFGIWGLHAPKRIVATTGLVICTIAFVLACYFLARPV